MSQAIFATFDPVVIGTHLGLSNGNLQLQTQIASDNLRMARSTTTAIVPSNVEFLIYSPDATKPALTSKAMMIGVCTNGASIANYIGGDANGWGYSPGDGNLYSNGVAVAFFGTATYGNYITLILDTINGTIAVLKDGQPIGAAYTLPANKKFYFGATVSGTPTGMALLGDSGALPIQFPIANMTGWWTPRVTIVPAYLGQEPYISKPTDTLKHQKFAGDIDGQQTPLTISRCVNVWTWGQSRPPGMSNGASISFDLLDPNKKYNTLLTSDARDLPVTISRVIQGGALDSAEAVYQAIFDRVDPLSDQSKRVLLKDRIVLTQQQLTRPVFPPTAEPSVAGKPRPMALGICRTYSPPLYDGTNFYYACSDAPITAFGTVRIQGVPQVYGGSYTITVDGAGIQTATSGTPTAPAGKITIESTSFAGVFSASNQDFLASQGLIGSLAIAGGSVLPTILCIPIWVANTFYAVNTKRTNGGNTYWCTTAGTSAASGGPTGTAVSGIVDGTCVWSYVGNSDYTAWQAGHIYTAGQYAYNGANTYKCTASGTSAGSGGPTGTAVSGIVDNTAQWGYAGIFSTGHQPAQGSNFTLNGVAPNKVLTGANVAAGSEWIFTNHPSYFITPGLSYAFSIKVKTAPYYGAPFSTPAKLRVAKSATVRLRVFPVPSVGARTIPPSGDGLRPRPSPR
jgi:hypothetical protein